MNDTNIRTINTDEQIDSDTRHKRGKPTLCWSCKYATGLPIGALSDQDNPDKKFRCPWATKHKPVCGWTARHTEYGTGEDHVESYHVSACPFYGADLITQIEALSSEDLATYVSIPTPSVNAHRKAAEWLLYTCITQEEYLTALLQNKECSLALKASGKAECTPNPLNEYDLPEHPFAITKRIRTAALKYAIKLVKEDEKISETDHEERYLRDLTLLAKIIVKERMMIARREAREMRRKAREMRAAARLEKEQDKAATQSNA